MGKLAKIKMADPNAPPVPPGMGDSPGSQGSGATPRSHNQSDTTLLPSPGKNPADANRGHITSPTAGMARGSDDEFGGSAPEPLGFCQRCWQSCWVCRTRFLEGVGRVFFPATRDINPEIGLPTRTEIATSLPLQIMLYYSAMFSAIWVVLFLASTLFKELHVAREESYSLYIYTINAVMQPAMFWAGYSGNLGEQAVELTGFWVMSVLSFGCGIFFLVGMPNALPIDKAINLLKTISDFLLIVAGYFSTRYMMKVQTTRFHVNQFVTNPTTTRMGNVSAQSSPVKSPRFNL